MPTTLLPRTKKWKLNPQPTPEECEAIGKLFNLNPIISTLLWQRGIRSFEEGRKFFRPQPSDLHDPFLMKDMDKAVARIQQAITRNEKIIIYGDYDVDGTTAVALVYEYFHSFYPHLDFYIPDRHKEGYGISSRGIQWASEQGASLVVALDVGIKAVERAEEAKQLGVDLIIADHHLPGEKIPDAVAVLDPKRADCAYPFKELSGCGIGFKLIQAYARRYRKEDEIFSGIDLVAISIAADIVPLLGENKTLAQLGIARLNENPRPSLRAMMELAGMHKKVTVTNIVFVIAPRLNAAGRLVHGKESVQFLLAKTPDEIDEKTKSLHEKNIERRSLDTAIFDTCIEMVQTELDVEKQKTIVLCKQGWNKGVVGIVASRIVEAFYRPTLILAETNGMVTGSGRSIAGFDLHEAITHCAPLLTTYGGHHHAVGLSLQKENLEKLKEAFEAFAAQKISDDMLQPTLAIDVDISFDQFTDKFFERLKDMEPFGPGNMKPVFRSCNVSAQFVSVLKEKHIRFEVSQEGQQKKFKAIAFDALQWLDILSQTSSFNMVFTVEENFFQDKISWQLVVKDIQRSDIVG